MLLLELGVVLLYVVAASQFILCEVYCCYIWEFFVVGDGSCTVVSYMRCTFAFDWRFLLYEMVAAQL